MDIIKELVESGEFKSVIPQQESLNDKWVCFILFLLIAVRILREVNLFILFIFRLKRLINEGKVMLFMKGNAKEPKCGFSRQIVELLNETG